jgi:hypothetical protein
VTPFEAHPKVVTDDITPAEMRALLRAMAYVFQDMDTFRRVNPKLIDQKCALSSVGKLNAALKACAGKRKGVVKKRTR